VIAANLEARAGRKRSLRVRCVAFSSPACRWIWAQSITGSRQENASKQRS